MRCRTGSKLRRGVLLLLLTLCGCTSVGERLIGWYITRQLDSYWDLSSAQEKETRAVVDDILHELRRDELPHWISFLREVRQGIHEGLNEESMARLQGHYDARMDRGVELLAPRAAGLLVKLSPRQLDHFAARMREDVEEHYEELKLSPEERRRSVEKRALKVVEDFVGALSDEQEDAIRVVLRSLPNERPLQYRSAHNNIRHFRAFMAKQPNVQMLELELRSMWERRYDGLGNGHDKTARRVVQRKALLTVYQLLNAKQRTHAEEELTDRIRMLKRFVQAAGPVRGQQ